MGIEQNVVFRIFDTIMFCVNINVSKEHTTSFFKVEVGGSMFLQNVGVYLWSYKVSKPRRLQSDIKALFAYTATNCTCWLCRYWQCLLCKGEVSTMECNSLFASVLQMWLCAWILYFLIFPKPMSAPYFKPSNNSEKYVIEVTIVHTHLVLWHNSNSNEEGNNLLVTGNW